MATQDGFKSGSQGSQVTVSQGGKPSDPKIQYYWVLTFRHNVSEEEPFEIHLIHFFKQNEIPSNWFTGRLNEDDRMEKLALNTLSDDFYSVFCKVERGE